MVSEEIGNYKRGEDGASLVYPVFSRRSGGLSLGINLFPNRKQCNFDCPYCEVSESVTGTVFDLNHLDRALKDFFEHSYPEYWAGVQIKDICISGNGEPTISPHLAQALELCAECRRRYASMVGSSELVIITNSTGFLNQGVSDLLARYVEREALKIWAKLDSGTQDGFSAFSRSEYGLEDIVDGIRSFAVRQPIILQTMLCRLSGKAPGVKEAEAYAAILNGLLAYKAKIEAIQLYTVARSTVDTSIQALSDSEILEYATLLKTMLKNYNSPPILLFGRDGAFKADRE
jgi:histidinol dehydrogenase